MKLIRTLSARLSHKTPNPPTRIGIARNQLHLNNKARFSRFLVVILVMAAFSAPPESQAAGNKVTLSAKTTTVAGTTLKVTARLTPRRSGVAITLLSSAGNTREIKTNAQGNAIFNIKLKKDARLSARISETPSVRSKSITISVFQKTKLTVNWPNSPISCTNEGIHAYVSPAISGRKVIMQYESDGDWVDEDTKITDNLGHVYLALLDDSNYESPGTTLLADERIVVQAKGRYLAVSAVKMLEYKGCATAEINAYYSGTETVGTPEIYTWDLSNADPVLWTDNNATVQIDVCNEGTNTCDPENQNMPSVYQDQTPVNGDDSGTFSWTPTVAGDYVIRISLWDNNQMIFNVSTAYSIGN